MKHVLPAAISWALLALACSGDTLVAPTPPQFRPGAPVPWPPYPISGTVFADATPVNGARILVFDDRIVTSRSTTTDDRGFYSFDDVGLVKCPACSMVSASKAGFFTDIKYADTALNGTLDFELDPLVFISVGQVVNGYTGEAGDAKCEGLGFGSSPCQRFAIQAPSTGTLRISSPGPFRFDFDVVKPDGTFATYSSGGPEALTMKINVSAGSIYELRVVKISADGYFQLTTALE